MNREKKMDKNRYIDNLVEIINEIDANNKKLHYSDSENKIAEILEYLTKFLIFKEIYKISNQKTAVSRKQKDQKSMKINCEAPEERK
jgi:hypothetical protein